MRLAAATIVIFLSIATSGHAKSLTDLLGVNDTIDHSVNGMIAVVDRAQSAAMTIENQFAVDANHALDRVDSMVDDTVDQVFALERQFKDDSDEMVIRVNALLADRLDQIDALKDELIAQLDGLIKDTQCAINVSLNQSLLDALGGTGRALQMGQILVQAPELYAGEQDPFCPFQYCGREHLVNIREPFTEPYKEIEDFLLGRLENTTERTPISTIITTYSYLANVAERGYCFMPENKALWRSKYQRYMDLTRGWSIVMGGH
jgi:hypothetical protein